MNPNNRSFGLDVMRALAICLVLVAHFAKTQEYFGFLGVEIFFALSGFLIGQILWRNFASTDNWTISHVFNFWSRRWWRTLPNYYLFIFITLAFTYYYWHKVPSIYELSKFLWFGQDLLTRDREFYGVSWSLCVEEWFYLLFPIVLFLYSRFIVKKSLAFVLTLLSFFVCCFIVREVLLKGDQADSIRTITFARLDAISYGVAIAYLFMVRGSSELMKKIALGVGLLFILSPLIIAVGLGITLHDLRHNQYLLIIVPLGAALTIPVISRWGRPMSKFISTGVEKLSLWSYSIYLSHIPILFTVYELMNGIRSTSYGNLLSKVVGLVITLIVSSILFKYIEVKFMHKRPPELN